MSVLAVWTPVWVPSSGWWEYHDESTATGWCVGVRRGPGEPVHWIGGRRWWRGLLRPLASVSCYDCPDTGLEFDYACPARRVAMHALRARRNPRWRAIPIASNLLAIAEHEARQHRPDVARKWADRAARWLSWAPACEETLALLARARRILHCPALVLAEPTVATAQSPAADAAARKETTHA